MLRKIERHYWRQRAAAMDRVYMHLAHHGLTSAASIACELDLEPGYVDELLEDLHVDAIVRQAGNLYYLNGDTYASVH